MPQRDIIDLSSLGHWHYDAIFVNCEAIEYAVLNVGRLPVGTEGDYWRIHEAATTIISLSSNTGPYNMGRTVWILAHLTYPLAWVLEYFNMARLGRDAPMYEVLCHTAGLVDIHSTIRHLIFVILTKTETSVSVGGRCYPIGTVDQDLMLPDNRRPQEWNLDEQISVMLRQALNCRNSLRREFKEFIRPMVPGGINWLEVDSLINVLTLRYCQRVEGVHRAQDDDTPYHHITYDSCSDYPVYSQEHAHQSPILMIGAWKNWAKLGITTRLAYYYLHNTENAQNVSLNGVASRVRTLEEEGVSSGYGDVPPGRIEL